MTNNIRRIYTLNPVEDADLIAFLEEQPNMSATVRDALRAYKTAHQLPLSEVLEEIVKLCRQILTTVATGVPVGTPVAADVRKQTNAIDNLVQRFREGN